jgi:hypothetical protein
VPSFKALRVLCCDPTECNNRRYKTQQIKELQINAGGIRDGTAVLEYALSSSGVLKEENIRRKLGSYILAILQSSSSPFSEALLSRSRVVLLVSGTLFFPSVHGLIWFEITEADGGLSTCLSLVGL